MSTFPTVTLESDGYRLTPFRVEDISDRYVSMLNNPAINQYLEIRWVEQTRETARQFVSSFYCEVEKYMWGISDVSSGQFIGTATLYQIDRRYGNAFFGVMIGDETYWGKGASTAVLRMLLKHTFDDLKLRRLVGGSHALNHGMNFTFKRWGFRREAHHVKAGISKKGEFIDNYLWAILEEEWRARANPAG